MTFANSATAPFRPSIFQIEPGPPLTVTGPNRPGMKLALAPPRRARSGRPSPSRSGTTIGRPYAELAARKILGGVASSSAIENTCPTWAAVTEKGFGAATSCPVGGPSSASRRMTRAEGRSRSINVRSSGSTRGGRGGTGARTPEKPVTTALPSPRMPEGSWAEAVMPPASTSAAMENAAAATQVAGLRAVSSPARRRRGGAHSVRLPPKGLPLPHLFFL